MPYKELQKQNKRWEYLVLQGKPAGAFALKPAEISLLCGVQSGACPLTSACCTLQVVLYILNTRTPVTQRSSDPLLALASLCSARRGTGSPSRPSSRDKGRHRNPTACAMAGVGQPAPSTSHQDRGWNINSLIVGSCSLSHVI